MILKFTLIFLFSSLSVGLSEKFRYDNYTLYKVLPENEQQIKLLQKVQELDTRFDFWNELGPLVNFALIVSGPQDKNDFENILKENKIKYEIKMKSIQE